MLKTRIVHPANEEVYFPAPVQNAGDAIWNIGQLIDAEPGRVEPYGLYLKTFKPDDSWLAVIVHELIRGGIA